MKALDARNETARQKQLKSDDPQPYHKLYIDTTRTCPFCDSTLRPKEREYWTLECDCSTWEQPNHPQSFRWQRSKKPATMPDTN